MKQHFIIRIRPCFTFHIRAGLAPSPVTAVPWAAAVPGGGCSWVGPREQTLGGVGSSSLDNKCRGLGWTSARTGISRFSTAQIYPGEFPPMLGAKTCYLWSEKEFAATFLEASMQEDWALGAIPRVWGSVSQTTNIRIIEGSLLKTQLLGLVPDLLGPVPWNLSAF